MFQKQKKINFVLNGFQPFLLPESFLLWLSAHSATVDKISMEFDELITYVTGGICGDWSGTSLGYKVVYPCLNFLQAGPQHTTHRYSSSQTSSYFSFKFNKVGTHWHSLSLLTSALIANLVFLRHGSNICLPSTSCSCCNSTYSSHFSASAAFRFKLRVGGGGYVCSIITFDFVTYYTIHNTGITNCLVAYRE